MTPTQTTNYAFHIHHRGGVNWHEFSFVHVRGPCDAPSCLGSVRDARLREPDPPEEGQFGFIQFAEREEKKQPDKPRVRVWESIQYNPLDHWADAEGHGVASTLELAALRHLVRFHGGQAGRVLVKTTDLPWPGRLHQLRERGLEKDRAYSAARWMAAIRRVLEQGAGKARAKTAKPRA